MKPNGSAISSGRMSLPGDVGTPVGSGPPMGRARVATTMTAAMQIPWNLPDGSGKLHPGLRRNQFYGSAVAACIADMSGLADASDFSISDGHWHC